MQIQPRILASLLLISCLMSTADDDWPTGRGPQQDGKSTLTGIRKDWSGGLAKVWSVSELCAGNHRLNTTLSAPVISQGILIVMGRSADQDLLFAFDADSGAPLWKKQYEAKPEKNWSDMGNGARAAPFIQGENVFTLGAYGHLACWNLKSGDLKWLIKTREFSKTNIPYWGVCGAPVVYQGNVLVKVGGYEQGPNSALVMAFEIATGKLAWKSADAQGSWAPLSIVTLDGKSQLLAWHARGLKGLDPASGKEFWNIPWSTAYNCHATIPAVEGSTLFLTSGYNAGCQAFSMKNDQPTALWPASKTISACNSDPVIHQGHVYSFSGNGPTGELKCINLNSGVECWKTKELGNGAFVALDGCLLCLAYNGKLCLVDAKPDAFQKLAEQKIFEVKGTPVYSPPVVARGKVYLRYQGDLVCYALK